MSQDTPRTSPLCNRPHRATAIATLLALFSTTVLCNANPSPEPIPWMGSGGTVLLQHPRAQLNMGLQAFKPNTTATHWTALDQPSHPWKAVAMDQSRILFFHPPDSQLSVCTLNEQGMPIDWLPIKQTIASFLPVAIEDHHILIQHETTGELKQIAFDEAGQILSTHPIWTESKGWIVRGMDCNRMILEHIQTGQVAIWAGNPKGRLFRPYPSFTLAPNWSVRDFSGCFVLIQHAETGAVQLVELGDEYKPTQYSELFANDEGWRAVALAN